MDAPTFKAMAIFALSSLHLTASTSDHESVVGIRIFQLNVLEVVSNREIIGFGVSGPQIFGSLQ